MALTAVLAAGIAFANDEFQREKLNFNQGWKFIRKNVPAAVDPAFPVKELEKWSVMNILCEPCSFSTDNQSVFGRIT
jgi:hypothetical protein